MTTLENANDGIPDDAPQEKLECVTPKRSLMVTTATGNGKVVTVYRELTSEAGPSRPSVPQTPPTPTKLISTNGSAKTLFNGLEH